MTPLVRRLAARAPVPVYPIAGFGMRDAVQDLRLEEGLVLVDTPRAAALLLVAGAIGPKHRDAVARTHDALPHPRATVLWGGDGDGLAIADAPRIDRAADVVPALCDLFARLVLGSRPTEEPILADEDPIEWRGVGPYGQGGTGMTGGTPYGRPMADLGPDRDGLRLDVVPVEIGPFFARLPAGLVLDLSVAGDVIVEAKVASASLGVEREIQMGAARSPFIRALSGPVAIAELEVARARDHLRWMAGALHAQGMPSLGVRALRLAHEVQPGDGDQVRNFGRWTARTGLFHWSLPSGAGRLAPDLPGMGLGPVSRAAGLPEDLRLADPSYQALGFAPRVLDADDVGARWRLRVEEAAAALDLAARAGDAFAGLTGMVESPRGRLTPGDAPSDRAIALIPRLLEGLEWSDALAALVSLDLDLDESGLAVSVDAAVAV